MLGMPRWSEEVMMDLSEFSNEQLDSIGLGLTGNLVDHLPAKIRVRLAEYTEKDIESFFRPDHCVICRTSSDLRDVISAELDRRKVPAVLMPSYGRYGD